MTFGECYYKVKEDYLDKYIRYERVSYEELSDVSIIEILFKSSNYGFKILCRLNFTRSNKNPEYAKVQTKLFAIDYRNVEIPYEEWDKGIILSYIFNPRADWDVEIKKYKKVEIEE